MYIGKLAKLTGTTPKAIRLYETLGLLSPAARRGRYRIYSDQDIVLVHTIRRGLAVGFTLKEMQGLIEHRQQTGMFSLSLGSSLIDEKRAQLAVKIQQLQAQDSALVELRDEIHRTFGELND